MYINGKWVGNELEKIEVVNPSTQQIVGTVPEGGRKEATLAVDAAHEAFKTWSKKTADERSSLLYRWYELIDENKEEMATLMTKEQGKPYQEAYGEVNYANGFIKWYAEEAKRIYGDTIPASK